MKIEALHHFHSEQFATDWSNRFVPTPARVSLFELILNNLDLSSDQPLHVLELGIGPGYLAEYILKRNANIIYEGLDFSKPMLDIASHRLETFEARTTFTEADLTDPTWPRAVRTKPDIIVSTWALHDLLSKENIFSVYKNAYQLLPKNGKLINGDFIKPETSTFDYEKGRIKPSEHLDLLERSGFKTFECVQIFEENIEEPTTANNYACFVALK